jgi:hypothetical protein
MHTILPELDPYNILRIEEYLKGKRKHGCFGIVRKRGEAPDISRQSWLDPYLYHLLMEFGRMHVPIPFTSIQLNEPHDAEHSSGHSYIVGFGNYQGGDLTMDLSGAKTSYNIRYKPLLYDAARIPHTMEASTGDRYSLIYYTVASPAKHPALHALENYEAVHIEGKYRIAARYPGREVFYIDSKNGLPSKLPPRKKKQPLSSEEPIIVPGMTAAQSLLLQAMEHTGRIV